MSVKYWNHEKLYWYFYRNLVLIYYWDFPETCICMQHPTSRPIWYPLACYVNSHKRIKFNTTNNKPITGVFCTRSCQDETHLTKDWSPKHFKLQPTPNAGNNSLQNGSKEWRTLRERRVSFWNNPACAKCVCEYFRTVAGNANAKHSHKCFTPSGTDTYIAISMMCDVGYDR